MKLMQNILFKINQRGVTVSELSRKEHKALQQHAKEKNDKVLIEMIFFPDRPRYRY